MGTVTGKGLRGIEGHQPDMVIVTPVDGPCPQPCHEAYEPGRRINPFFPDIGIEGVGHPCGERRMKPVSRCARDALYEEGHLFIRTKQAAIRPVEQGLTREGTGIDPAHSFTKLAQPLVRCPLVCAKHAFIFT